jgi:aldose 1-epimerase
MSADSDPEPDGHPIAFLPLGAIIQHFYVGPRNIDIVQGFDEEEHYKAYNAPFFGETIGRVANRISNGKINDLNGRSYQLAMNNPPNALHGGEKGWGKKTWDGPMYRGLKDIHLGLQEPVVGEQYTFCLVSGDGDEGYPGTVEVQVFYTTGTRKNDLGKTVQVLLIEYEARLVDDGTDVEETVVNITNHSYVYKHFLSLFVSSLLPFPLNLSVWKKCRGER